MQTYQGVLHRYQDLLDLPEHTRPVTLLEGDTPLIPATRLAEQLGGGFELFVKFEGMNPTGSFKDRGMTAAISEALGRGAKAVICASTDKKGGNGRSSLSVLRAARQWAFNGFQYLVGAVEAVALPAGHFA